MLYSLKIVLILAFPPCVPWSVFCRFSGHFFFSHFPSFPFLMHFTILALIFSDFFNKIIFLGLYVIKLWVLCFSYLLLWVPREIRKMKRGFYYGGCPSPADGPHSVDSTFDSVTSYCWCVIILWWKQRIRRTLQKFPCMRLTVPLPLITLGTGWWTYSM